MRSEPEQSYHCAGSEEGAIENLNVRAYHL